MAPYLQTVKSFADVPVTDAGVDTVSFLEAARGVVGIFNLLGSTAFAAVTSDMTTNIDKVQKRFNDAPNESQTLEELVKKEPGKKPATEGLLWLMRGLDFTSNALQKTQANKKEELPTAFRDSYSETLSKHHNFIVKGIFSVAMVACPNREGLYLKLKADESGGPPASDEELDVELNKWLAALREIINRISIFYKNGGHGKL